MDAGLAVPPWDELADTPPRREEEPEPSQPKMGWQQRASRKLEAKFLHDSVWPALDDSASSPHPFTVWASGVSTADDFADVQGHKVGSSTFSPPVVQETPLASSSVHAHLPMWPPA